MASDANKQDIPRTGALRIALAVIALGVLGAAGVGAYMSVTINWEFAKTLGKDMKGGFYVALTLAAVEASRIMMPFMNKGLKIAGLPHKWTTSCFVLFTIISLASCIGYFSMNRSAATDQRAIQMSLSKGYKTDLATLTKALERNADVRSIGEIEAEIKSLPKGDLRIGKLEVEKAAAKARDIDRKRLEEMANEHRWQTSVPSADAKDAQAETLADLLAIVFRGAEKTDLQHWVVIGLTIVAALSLELLVGVSPFASVMVLIWACRRPEDAEAEKREGNNHQRDGPTNGITNGSDQAENQKRYGFRPLPRKSSREALADLRQLSASGVKIPSQKWLAERWNWSESSVHRHMQDWAANGEVRVEHRGRGKCNAISVAGNVMSIGNGHALPASGTA